MSFTHDFTMECRRLAPLFAAAANADREFHAGWKEGLVRLGVGRYKQTEQYRRTLDRFNQSRQLIDHILATALSEAKAGKGTHLATLFAYLALPGRYYRSGYERASIWRFLKRLAYNLDKLATTGIFGIVRNPIYSAWIIFIIPGLVLLSRSWPLFFTPVVAYVIFKARIGRENEYLEQHFGDDYRTYKAQVNELVPFPRRK